MKKIKIILAAYLLTTLTTASLLCQEPPVAEQPALRVHIASLEQRALHAVVDQWYKDSFRKETNPRLSQFLVESIQQIDSLKDKARRKEHWGITPEQCINSNRNADTLNYILWHTQEGYNKRNSDALKSMVSLAVESGNDDCLASLLAHARAPQTLIEPATLFAAIRKNKLPPVKILLEHGANPNVQDYTPALHIAVDADASIEIIQELLKKDPSNIAIETPSYGGKTILYAAAINHHDPAVIQLLIQNGAQLESRDDSDYTPLDSAATFGNSSAVSALLQAGANPVPRHDSMRTVLNLTLLQLAAAKNFGTRQEHQPSASQSEYYSESIEPLTETALLLIRSCDKLFANTDTIKKILKDVGPCESSEIIQALQARGINLSLAPDEKGNTLLHKAIHEQQPTTCTALLNAGVPVNIQNADGNTPLHEAYRMDNDTLIEQLLTAGANPEIRNNAEQKPSDLARKRVIRTFGNE